MTNAVDVENAVDIIYPVFSKTLTIPWCALSQIEIWTELVRYEARGELAGPTSKVIKVLSKSFPLAYFRGC